MDLPCSRSSSWLHAGGKSPRSTSIHSRYRELRSCLPLSGLGSATAITIDFGAMFPFTAVPACNLPVYAWQRPLPADHARLGTRLARPPFPMVELNALASHNPPRSPRSGPRDRSPGRTALPDGAPGRMRVSLPAPHRRRRPPALRKIAPPQFAPAPSSRCPRALARERFVFAGRPKSRRVNPVERIS
jgi:hypothetical protein